MARCGRDGRVSRSEFKGPPPLFQRLDRDRDDMLTAGDLARQAVTAERSGAAWVRDDTNVKVPLEVVFGTGGGRDLTTHLVLPMEQPSEPCPASPRSFM